MTVTPTRQDLLNLSSKALEKSAAMDASTVAAHLGAVPDWALVSGAIERTFNFKDYWHTLAFINALAYVVHRQDHHPEITFGYNRATVRFDTHSVKGISLNDFICAAKADALYAARPGPDA